MRAEKTQRLKVHWHSLGCKVNLADLGAVAASLPADVFDFSAPLEEADLAILNTCTVTHKADRDWRKILSGWRRRKPSLPVWVAGCACANREKEILCFPNVARLFRPGEQEKLQRELLALVSGPCSDGSKERRPFPLARQRAFLKVQDGCNNRCSYCVVSLLRGPERSLSIEDALRAAERALASGVRELVLCGIHLGRFGRDRGTSLAALLRALHAMRPEKSGWRVRMSSLEPLELDEDLLRTVAETCFVCRHFHVPMQSADDRLLARMNRPYGCDQAKKKFELIRSYFPGAAIGTDLIAGFPGEDHAAHQRTLSMVQEGWFDYLHVFAFSARAGTPAAGFAERVPAAVIKERVRELREAGKKRWDDFLRAGIGKEHQVLVEKCSGGKAFGRSGEYRRLEFDAAGSRPGEIITVIGTAVEAGILSGRRVEE